MLLELLRLSSKGVDIATLSGTLSARKESPETVFETEMRQVRDKRRAILAVFRMMERCPNLGGSPLMLAMTSIP